MTFRRNASEAAALSESCGLAIKSKRAPAKIGSPGFGVSSAAVARCAATAGGGVMPYFASTARASANVEASGTVGPDAMTAGSSPGTSEIANVTTRAGAAAAASRPPLIAERCLRTVLISPIVAPQRNSARVTACLSLSDSPGAGSVNSAEPPPEARNTS